MSLAAETGVAFACESAIQPSAASNHRDQCPKRGRAMHEHDRTKPRPSEFNGKWRAPMSDRVAGKPKHTNTLINVAILVALISASVLVGMAMAPSKPQGMTVVATVKK
jgi:hypothetical protein